MRLGRGEGEDVRKIILAAARDMMFGKLGKNQALDLRLEPSVCQAQAKRYLNQLTNHTRLPSTTSNSGQAPSSRIMKILHLKFRDTCLYTLKQLLRTERTTEEVGPVQQRGTIYESIGFLHSGL